MKNIKTLKLSHVERNRISACSKPPRECTSNVVYISVYSCVTYLYWKPDKYLNKYLLPRTTFST